MQIDPSEFLRATIANVGGLSLSVYTVGAALVSLSVAFAFVGTILFLVNRDMFAYYNEKNRVARKKERYQQRQQARKEHMKRVNRYQAYLDGFKDY